MMWYGSWPSLGAVLGRAMGSPCADGKLFDIYHDTTALHNM